MHDDRWPRPWQRKPRFRTRIPYSARAVAFKYCAEAGEEVPFEECLDCPNYAVWEEEDIQRCRHEYEKLKGEGHYAKTQQELERDVKQYNPGAWPKLIEKERMNEKIWNEMQKEDEELGKMTADQDDYSTYDEYDPEMNKDGDLEDSGQEGDSNDADVEDDEEEFFHGEDDSEEKEDEW